MGVPIKWRGGEYGWISSWQHPACLRVPDVSREQLAREIHGLDQLSSEHRDLVLDELTSKEAVKLEEIDPDDPAHCKPADPIPRLPTPAALSRPLLSFQEEGLGWLVANEAGPIKGGILADEMGMGKTIQTISLLLHAKSERASRAVACAKRGEALARAERPAPTLVVVPTSALPQWKTRFATAPCPIASRAGVLRGSQIRDERGDRGGGRRPHHVPCGGGGMAQDHQPRDGGGEYAEETASRSP